MIKHGALQQPYTPPPPQCTSIKGLVISETVVGGAGAFFEPQSPTGMPTCNYQNHLLCSLPRISIGPHYRSLQKFMVLVVEATSGLRVVDLSFTKVRVLHVAPAQAQGRALPGPSGYAEGGKVQVPKYADIRLQQPLCVWYMGSIIPL